MKSKIVIEIEHAGLHCGECIFKEYTRDADGSYYYCAPYDNGVRLEVDKAKPHDVDKTGALVIDSYWLLRKPECIAGEVT